MSAVRLKIEPWFKRLLYTSLSVSWVTGTSFFILNTWVRIEGEFGPEKHPWQFLILTVHGLAAFFMLMVSGAIFSNHVPMGWRSKRLRKVGISLVTVVSCQLLSAYLLYYLGDPTIREIVMYLHLSIGFSLPFVLWLHIYLGKKNRPQRGSQPPKRPRRPNRTPKND